jgi:predicted RNA-binding protein with TRAM domain
VANRRLVLEGREDVPLDHLVIAGHGSVDKVMPPSPISEGSEVSVKLVEVGKHDLRAGVGVHKGLTVTVAGAAKLVGKRARARVERVLDGTAYATLVEPADLGRPPPITAESQAEQPTRGRTRAKKPEAAKVDEQRPKAPRKKRASQAEAPAEAEAGVDEEPAVQPSEPARAEAPQAEEPPKKKTRRGSRGGRGRKRKPAAVSPDGAGALAEAAARIHLPSPELGDSEPAAANDGAAGAEEQPPAAGETSRQPDERAAAAPEAPGEEGAAAPAAPRKRKTRRGSRGGRGRKRKTTAPSAE